MVCVDYLGWICLDGSVENGAKDAAMGHRARLWVFICAR